MMRATMKPRPNAPCPCGSGRKYKKCHGAPAAATAAPGATMPGAADWIARGAQLEAAAQPEPAERCYREALRQDPTSAPAWLAAGRLAMQRGDAATALDCYSRLVALQPDRALGHFALGNLHALLYAFDAARSAYLRALELEPTHAGAWGNLGNVEKYCGNFARALECHRRAVECETDPAQQARRHSNLLLSLHYDESLSHEAMLAAHREWADRHARHLYPLQGSWPNPADPDRPLRIGYVSASFAATEIMGHFLQSVLDHHDRARFRIHLYSSTRAPAAQTARLRAAAAEWIEIGHLDDGAAAARIRADAIDVLVDLDGHNPTGRPLIFARKPAPVQVEWLDWFDTSGMATIDAILTDPYTTPLDSPQRYAETPVRLPHTRLCYTPVDHAPAVAPMPCLAGAPFTFGSFNRQDKLHPALLAVWAEILRAVPGSRLLLKNRALQVAAVRRSVEASFAQCGIGPDRLLLRGPSPHADMLGEYRDVDVALDTFPYNGGLTTCECLWMGVPIVALEGARMIGRQTSAMLRLLGLGDWVATSVDDYVRLAVDRSRRVDAAARLRATLRERFAASPVCDAARFARDLEAAYRSLWRDHCLRAGLAWRRRSRSWRRPACARCTSARTGSRARCASRAPGRWSSNTRSR